MLTKEQFLKICPENKEPDAWVTACEAILPKYSITNPLRLAGFLSQCGHESEGFTAVKENLNYSAAALTATWPKRFPPEVAQQYARQPEKVGNRAYANRLGNGPEESGDGYRYRGRGAIQTTGKGNYLDFAKSVGMTLEAVTAYLETKEGALESACYYWKTRNLNALADKEDVLGMTKAINGGTNGLEDRQRRYNIARSCIG